MPEIQEVREESSYNFGQYQPLARLGEDEDGYQREQGELPPEKPIKKSEEENRLSEETDSPDVSKTSKIE